MTLTGLPWRRFADVCADGDAIVLGYWKGTTADAAETYKHQSTLSEALITGMLSEAWHNDPQSAFDRNTATPDILDNVDHSAIRLAFSLGSKDPSSIDSRNPENRLSIDICSDLSDIDAHYKEARSKYEPTMSLVTSNGVRDIDEVKDCIDIVGLVSCPEHGFEFISPTGAISINKNGTLNLESREGWTDKVKSTLSNLTSNLPH